jgi:hypothetical protein
MRSLHEEGGTAFPTEGAPGMTLRDYFAAKCMADVLGHFSWDEPEIDKAAAFAFKLADAMLKAREAK